MDHTSTREVVVIRRPRRLPVIAGGLLGWFILAVTLALAIYVTWMIYRAGAGSELRIQTEIISDKIDSFILDSRILGSLEIVGKGNDLAAARQTAEDAASPGCPEILNTLKDMYGASSVYFLDGDGKIISCTHCAGSSMPPPENFKSSPCFTKAFEGKSLVYPCVSRMSGEKVICYSCPVYGGDGIGKNSICGALVLEMDAASLLHFMRIIDSKGELLLVSPSGIVFLSTLPEWDMHVIFGTLGEDRKILSDTCQFGSGNALKSMKPLPFDLGGGTVALRGETCDVADSSLGLSDSLGRWKLYHLHRADNSDAWLWIAGEVAAVVMIAILAKSLGYYYRRNRELRERERKDTERLREFACELEYRNRELQQALSEVKTLGGLLPICAHCKKIRDDKGYWNRVEDYIKRNASVEFTHGICPECTDKVIKEYGLDGDSVDRKS